MTMSKLALDDFDPVQGEDKRVANFLHALEGGQLLFGAGRLQIEGFEVSINEFDGFEEDAGGFAFPDFAKAAAAQRLDQAVARECEDIRLAVTTHQVTRGQATLGRA